MATYSIKEIAKYIGADFIGDDTVNIHGIAPLQHAKKGHIAFLDNSVYHKYLSSTHASAVVLLKKYAEECSVSSLIVPNPYYAYAQLSHLFARKINSNMGIHPTAVIADDANIAEHCSIAAGAVIASSAVIGEKSVIGAGVYVGENVSIGKGVHIHPKVTLHHETIIEDHVIVHSGAVIGSDGFGNAKHSGKWHKIAQLGRVIIRSDAEIGANTTIDRGALGDTVIGQGVKLDNLIQIGHNVSIGDHTAIAGCAAVGGTTKIGSHCLIGGGVCVAGHITICDDVAITGMSGVSKSISKPGVYSSTMIVQEHKTWQKNLARIRQLDKLFLQFKKVKKLLKITD